MWNQPSGQTTSLNKVRSHLLHLSLSDFVFESSCFCFGFCSGSVWGSLQVSPLTEIICQTLTSHKNPATQSPTQREKERDRAITPQPYITVSIVTKEGLQIPHGSSNTHSCVGEIHSAPQCCLCVRVNVMVESFQCLMLRNVNCEIISQCVEKQWHSP